jgi:hypothetical protein
MAPMSTMNGRRVTIFTGRNFLRTTAAGAAWWMGVVGAAHKGGIGGV